MRTLSRLLMLAALATVFALPAFAQDQPAAAGACDAQEKNDLYTQYYNLKKSDQAKAFDIAKQYLDKYGSCTDNYTASVKKFHDAYKAASEGVQLRNDFYASYNAKNWAKVNSDAQQLLAANQNDTAIALLAAWGNYMGLGTKAAGATQNDALNYATKAFDLIQSGQEPKDANGMVSYSPFSSKDEAVASLNLEIGSLETTTNADDAMKRLVSVAQGSTKAKEAPNLYGNLGFLYEKQAAQLLEQYKAMIAAIPATETDESKLVPAKLVLANFNRVLDQAIDAYARQAAYTADATQKADVMKHLTDLYKSRHDNKTDGLDAFVAGIKNTPYTVSEPITTLPATPAPGEGAMTTNGTTNTPTAAPVANPATPTTNTTKPATTTTAPAKTPAPSKKPPVSRLH